MKLRNMLSTNLAAPTAALLLAVMAAGPAGAQTLTFVQGADANSLDPHVTQSTTSHIIFRHIFNGLIKWDGPQMTEIVPDLATSWKTSEDGLQWTFQLREGVKFHDGETFDAEAVKFNIDRLIDSKTGSPVRSLFAPIGSVNVVDKKTVRIDLTSPLPSLLELLADEYGSMNSPNAVMEKGKGYAVSPVGTGPYVFKEWAQNELARVERNPNYFGVAGKPKEIIFRPVPENGARVVEIESGNVDIAGNIPPESAPQLEKNKDVTLVVKPSSFQIFFELNTTAEPFKDVRIRQAASYAIDREAIVSQILGGYGSVPTSPFPAGVPGRAKFSAHPYDPAKARQLIKEVYPNGFPGTVVMWTPAGRYMKDKSVAEAVQAYLNAVGLKTEFRVWEWAAYQRELYKTENGGTGRGTNAASMWLLGTGVTIPDRRLRGKLAIGGDSNITGYKNPEVQELLKSAATETNYDARMKLYGKVQDIVWNKDPNGLPLFDQVQILAVKKGVSEPAVFSDEIVLFDQVTK